MTSSIELSARASTPTGHGSEQRTSVLSAQETHPSSSKWVPKEYVHFTALCYAHLITGYSDATAGPLIPRIQAVYNVNFAVVSLVFVFNMLGFVLAALMNMWLAPRLAFGKLLALSAVIQTVAYVIMAPGPPFPVFILAYLINGFGISLQSAQVNGYIAAQTRTPAVKMGLVHASYGIGALVSPLVATQFSTMPRWSFHFLTSLGLAIINTCVLISVFRGRSQEDCLHEMADPIAASNSGTDAQNGMFGQIMRRRTIHFIAMFILVYVGLEVTIGGWIVTYIISERGGGPSSGYISSGFFGGLFLGRVALLWINHKIGPRRVIFLYAALVLGLEIVAWRVPSLVGNAIAVSFAGFFLGPMYPLAMTHTASILPPWLITGAAGYIAGLGQAGSALFPFVTGVIANKAGIESLQPLLLSVTVFMTLVWVLVPSSPPQTVENHRDD